MDGAEAGGTEGSLVHPLPLLPAGPWVGVPEMPHTQPTSWRMQDRSGSL